MSNSITKYIIAALLFFAQANAMAQGDSSIYHERFRPQIHFSPKAHWMNDPNGMVYYKGVYHLFFQYYPGGTTWGPMHWGHATSTDIVHWQEQPIALYPDKLGYIFSGSAVADVNNTSGFGKNGVPPLVAVYTNHDTAGEYAGKNTFQNQSIAYSLDESKSWRKYAGNPVVTNPGIKDFRDPKVSWYEPAKKWIMTLATKDRITFYSSPDLKHWAKQSEFGEKLGAHGGVWECPDLFPLEYGGKQHWILTVSINPGAPNGGSGTQYFVGQFNGNTFKPYDTATKWIDYGPDDYAGVTWSNTGNRKIFLGWMSNWNYANVVPTAPWRGANTIPRELSLRNVNGRFYIASAPVKELDVLNEATQTNTKIPAGPFVLRTSVNKKEGFTLTLSNNENEKVVIGYDLRSKQFYISRDSSGATGFAKNFTGKHVAPSINEANVTTLTIYVDYSSIELFTDNGLIVMTSLVFPSKPYNNIQIQSHTAMKTLTITPLKSTWK